MALALASCDFPPTFGDEYKNTDENWIRLIPLASPPLATDTSSLDQSAIWDWSWRGRPATGNTFQYMNLTQATSVTDAVIDDDNNSLDSGTAVWRLELPNLFLNGDFEKPIDGAAFSGLNSTYAIDAVSSIHQNSLDINVGDETDDYVAFDMAKLLADIASTGAGGTYKLRMLLGSATEFRYRDSTLSTIDSAVTFKANPDTSGSLFITQSFINFNQGNAFVLADMINPITIDDVRAVRTDIVPYLRLLLNPGNTSPTLVKGQYEFSVWMRTAETDKIFDDTTRIDHPYAARNATLLIRQVRYRYDPDDETSALDPVVTSRTAVSVDSTWRRFAVRLESPNNMDVFDEDTDKPVLELAIAPTLDDPMDAGAVLIAAPALNFYINGF